MLQTISFTELSSIYSKAEICTIVAIFNTNQKARDGWVKVVGTWEGGDHVLLEFILLWGIKDPL